MKLINNIILDAFLLGASSAHAQKADIIITNGKISTLDNEYINVAPSVLPVIPAWRPVKYFGGYKKK